MRMTTPKGPTVPITLCVELPDEKRGRSGRPAPELDPDLVDHWLRPIFPDLMVPSTADAEVEIASYTPWFQMRLTLQGGTHGVQYALIEVWQLRHWYEAIDEQRTQLVTVVVDPMLGLAHASGGRLLVDEVGLDMTDAEPAEIAGYFIQPASMPVGHWSPQAAPPDNAATAEAAMDDDYLEQFLEAAAPRLQWLRDQAAQSGGPAPERLDFSRASLVPLWSWAAHRFPVHRGRKPKPEPTPRPKPVWFGRLGRTPAPWWPIESLEMMDAIGYYLGGTLIRAVPRARWAIYRSADGRPNYHSGQVVITGFGPEMDLGGYVESLAGETMFNPDDAYVLQKKFDLMMSWATPGQWRLHNGRRTDVRPRTRR
jgi:hypothetical protein